MEEAPAVSAASLEAGVVAAVEEAPTTNEAPSDPGATATTGSTTNQEAAEATPSADPGVKEEAGNQLEALLESKGWRKGGPERRGTSEAERQMDGEEMRRQKAESIPRVTTSTVSVPGSTRHGGQDQRRGNQDGGHE